MTDRLSAPEALLAAKLGHDRDDDESIALYLRAERAFEAGDNKAATIVLYDLLSRDLSDELSEEAQRLLRRIRPNRLALGVVLLCAVLLAMIWLLAVRP